MKTRDRLLGYLLAVPAVPLAITGAWAYPYILRAYLRVCEYAEHKEAELRKSGRILRDYQAEARALDAERDAKGLGDALAMVSKGIRETVESRVSEQCDAERARVHRSELTLSRVEDLCREAESDPRRAIETTELRTVLEDRR